MEPLRVLPGILLTDHHHLWYRGSRWCAARALHAVFVSTSLFTLPSRCTFSLCLAVWLVCSTTDRYQLHAKAQLALQGLAQRDHVCAINVYRCAQMYTFYAHILWTKAYCAGLFVPSVLVGACYGRMVGSFVTRLHPNSTTVDESAYALLGSASYMAGSMRLVVSVCVMLLELTNQLSLLPLMMLVLVVARAVGDGSGVLGTYSIQTKLKAFPLLPPLPEKSLRHVNAEDLCAHSPAVALPRVVRVDQLLDVLHTCKHNGFPVLGGCEGHLPALDGRNDANANAVAQSEQQDRPVQLLGTILRHHLLVLLKSGRAFQHSPLLTHNSQRIAFMYKMLVRPIPSRNITSCELSVAASVTSHRKMLP